MDADQLLETWRAQAKQQPVREQSLSDDGRLLNFHARLVDRPAAEVYARLNRMGSPLDDLWPLTVIPMKAEGALAPGVRASHGPVRYQLAEIEDGRLIRWQFTMDQLHGDYQYVVDSVGGWTYVENVIDGQVSDGLIAAWRDAIGPFHDWVIERIFDRLDAPPVPWFNPALAAELR